MAFSSDNIQVFLSVLDQGSFSAAARSLSRVPSAVSMAIAHLEADLNLVLFDRSGREPRPTPQALALVPQARLLAEQLLKLDTHALSLTQGLEPCLTIAVAPELLAATPWSAALVQLSAEHPLLEVEVLAAPQTDALGMLHSGRAHVALVFERASLDAREGFQEVGREILVAVVAPTHPMLRGRQASRGVREDDLAVQRQIVVAGRHSVDADERTVMSRHQWRTDTPVAAMGLVIAGLGWAWLPQGFVRSPLAAGLLVEIPLENFSNVMPLWVDAVWPKTRPLGVAARRFLALLDGVRRQGEPPGKSAAVRRRPIARG